MKHAKRLERIERAAHTPHATRIFVHWENGRITEHGIERTQSDVDQAARDGFKVVNLVVVSEPGDD